MSNTNEKIEVRDLRTGDWLWTHKCVLFSMHISASDFKVYSGLAAYAGNIDQRSWPSTQTLATKLNLGKSTVLRSLKVLEACKVVSIERREGTSNLYSLLQVTSVSAPDAPKRAQSPHHRLVEFFHETTKITRKITPVWNAKDTAHLKRVLKMGILTEDQLEQLMLYFLAAPQFKKFSPSMATFFSAGIFNGLQNTMKNDATFWKDLDNYTTRLMARDNKVHRKVEIPMQSMAQMVKQLTEKFTLK